MENNSLEINSKIENYHKIINYQNRKNILYEHHPVCTRVRENNVKKEQKKYNQNVLFYHGDQQQVVNNQNFMNTKTRHAPIIFNNQDDRYMLQKPNYNNLKEGDLREITNTRINHLTDISQEINIKGQNKQVSKSNPFLNERIISSKYENTLNKDNGFRLNMGKSNFPVNSSIQFQTNYGVNTREKKNKIKEETFPRSLPKSNNNLYSQEGYSNPVPIDRGKTTQDN